MNLDEIMSFDHVVSIAADGTVTDAPATVAAPMLTMGTDGDGSIMAADEADFIAQAELQGWSILRGWTGQDGYHGLVMHSSEFIGGGLADHILSTPGLWVAITVDTLDDGDDGPDGWTLAYRGAD